MTASKALEELETAMKDFSWAEVRRVLSRVPNAHLIWLSAHLTENLKRFQGVECLADLAWSIKSDAKALARPDFALVCLIVEWYSSHFDDASGVAAKKLLEDTLVALQSNPTSAKLSPPERPDTGAGRFLLNYLYVMVLIVIPLVIIIYLASKE